MSGRVVRDLAFVAFAALPVSMGVGILKYHLYDIDRIISRTLAYTLVTGLLVGVYAGLVRKRPWWRYSPHGSKTRLT